MTIYAKVSQSQLYEIIQAHSYSTFSHSGLNIFIQWLFDNQESDAVLLNITDLLMNWREGEITRILWEYDVSSVEELKEQVRNFIEIPQTTRAIYES